MINRCLVSNFYLELYIYTLPITFFTYTYKSKFGGVLQECHGYGYVDMMQMKKKILIFL